MNTQFVKAQNLVTETKDLVADKVRNEEGEVASWLILAAGLAAAAFAASGQLGSLISTLVGNVEGAANGGG